MNDYLNQLKSMNVKHKTYNGGLPTVSTTIDMPKVKTPKKIYLNEIFVQASEIESLPSGSKRDMQIIRLGIIAEMDASNLYEKLELLAKDKQLKKVLLDISREEKVHVGEFKTLLDRIDPEYDKAEEEGEKEIEN